MILRISYSAEILCMLQPRADKKGRPIKSCKLATFCMNCRNSKKQSNDNLKRFACLRICSYSHAATVVKYVLLRKFSCKHQLKVSAFLLCRVNFHHCISHVIHFMASKCHLLQRAISQYQIHANQYLEKALWK